MRHRITEGVYSHRAVARSSVEWQAAYSLAKGAKAFRVWRDQRTRGRKSPLYLNLHRFEFQGLDLAGADLSGMRLTGTTFVGCSLQGARLRGTNLNGAALRNCNVTDVDFEQAKLVGTDLSKHDLSGINFYGSSRDGWRIDNVRCEFAWVHEARGTGVDPTHFREGEFEFTHGGRKVVLSFPDEGQAIDLLALPFHFQRLQEVYPEAQISLVGLRFSPTAAMEVRIDSGQERIPAGLEAAFRSQVPDTRRDVAGAYAALVASLQHSTDAHLRTIDSQQEMIARLVGMLDVSRGPVGGVLVQPGGTYVSAHSATVSTQVGDQYFGIPTNEIPALLRELETLRGAESALDPDLSTAVDELARAIEGRDEDAVRKVAHSAGKRLLDVAEHVGTSVLSKLLERMLGWDT